MTDSMIAKNTFRGRAFLVGERLDLRALESTDRVATLPLTLAVQGGGYAVFFRYGAVVLFDVAALEEAAFLNGLKPFLGQPFSEPETESVDIRIEAGTQERVEGGAFWLVDASVERLQLVADILAKSVVLARYETSIAQAFDLVEPVAVRLERGEKTGRFGKELLRIVGRVLLSEQRMIGRVAVVDKPDLLWERPDLERLYARLGDEYEIQERMAVLERKLDLISRTANAVLDLGRAAQTLRVEWYIVILIVIEIALTLYEMFGPT